VHQKIKGAVGRATLGGPRKGARPSGKGFPPSGNPNGGGAVDQNGRVSSVLVAWEKEEVKKSKRTYHQINKGTSTEWKCLEKKTAWIKNAGRKLVREEGGPF